MAKKWGKPSEAVEAYVSIDTPSEDTQAADTAPVPKSYSLPTKMHKQLADIAKKRTRETGERISASQVLREIIRKELGE